MNHTNNNMNVYTRIVQSIKEPDIGSLWLKDNKLYIYQEGVWVQLGASTAPKPSSTTNQQN